MDGRVYLITGLAGTGKTTLGKMLYDYIRNQKKNVIIWDGDITREIFDEEYDKKYDRDSRLKASIRDARIISMLSNQGIDVVVCVIAMFDCFRKLLRENSKNYFEIFLDCPMDILVSRDKNGLYSRAINNEIQNVVGVDIVPEFPSCPDLTIYNDGTKDINQLFELIKDEIINKSNRGESC